MLLRLYINISYSLNDQPSGGPSKRLTPGNCLSCLPYCDAY